MNILVKSVVCAAFLAVAANAVAQVKPNTQTQPSSTTQTLNTKPSAYADNKFSYVRTYDAQRPLITESSVSATNRTVSEVKQTTQYVDGLGRPIQTVVEDISPNGYDMVSPQTYDNFGREVFKYLPYVDPTNDGNFKLDPFANQANFEKALYNPTNDANGEKFYYGKTDYEASPLMRPSKIYAPGNSWVGRGVGTSVKYLLNTTADSVAIWNIGYTTGSIPSYNGFYPSNRLMVTKITDERGYSVIAYKDLEGHTVLKKVQTSTSGSYSGPTGWLNTYYVYDEVGNLRFVIQPKAIEYMRTHTWGFDGSTWTTSTLAKELCFSYEYDNRGRMTIARVPGANEVWMVYDQRDRLVMTQDSLQRSQGKWVYTDYDSINRPVLTGIWTNSSDRGYHQSQAEVSISYPTPTSNYIVLTETYYDNYNWVSGSGSGLPTSAYTGLNGNSSYFLNSTSSTFPYPRSLSTTNLTRGMVTGSKVNVVNTTNYLFNVSFFDDRRRIVQVQSTNYTGDIDTVINQYSFVGQVLRTLVCHGKGGSNAQTHRVLTKNSYDAAGRLMQVTQKTGNSDEVIIVQSQYDELGQLLQKSIGQKRTSLTDYSYTTTPMDVLNYSYNIRGWLRGINKDYANAINNTSWFGMELNYDFGFSTTYLNGDIAGIKWRNANDGAQRAYGFSYDGANRLTKADFTQNAGSNAWDVSAGIDFSVHKISYDQNGNITAMTQMGVKLNASVLVDSLSYSYLTNTNRLNYVTDRVNDLNAKLGDFTEVNNNTSQDYLYDGNGNLTKDNNKSISNIRYNFLNLPDSVAISGKGYIKYVYAATGAKLQKLVVETNISKITRTDYQGLFVYQNDTLQYVATIEGRARPKNINQSDTMFYDYFEKDHLGNTRVVLTDEQQQDNYPAATLENNASSFALQQNYYDINIADTVSVGGIGSWVNTMTGAGYHNNNGPYNNDPYINKGAASSFVYKLNGANGHNSGLGITLKVMAGDVVDVYAKSFWHDTSFNPTNTYSLLASSIINAFAGTSVVSSATKGAAGSAFQQTGSLTTSTATSWLSGIPNPTSAATPRAYVNWVLFDEQFKVVSSGSGFDLVSTTPNNVKNHHNTLNIGTGGYLYVYCSNESNYNVYFDNLQLIHTRGPLLETDNYYPFGLVQTGISSQAAVKLEDNFKFNGKELQHKEFSDGSGIEWYDYGARMYDCQIGKWHVVDPLSENSASVSPYSYCVNNPVNLIDPNGLEPVNNDWIKGRFDAVSDGTIGSYADYANREKDDQQNKEYNVTINGQGTLISTNNGNYQFANGVNGWGFYNVATKQFIPRGINSDLDKLVDVLTFLVKTVPPDSKLGQRLNAMLTTGYNYIGIEGFTDNKVLNSNPTTNTTFTKFDPLGTDETDGVHVKNDGTHDVTAVFAGYFLGNSYLITHPPPAPALTGITEIGFVKSDNTYDYGTRQVGGPWQNTHPLVVFASSYMEDQIAVENAVLAMKHLPLRTQFIGLGFQLVNGRAEVYNQPGMPLKFIYPASTPASPSTIY